VLDEVVQLFDQAVSGRESRAKHKLTDQVAERAKRSGIGMSRLRAALAEPATTRLPRDHGHLAQLSSSYAYLRQFTRKCSR